MEIRESINSVCTAFRLSHSWTWQPAISGLPTVMWHLSQCDIKVEAVFRRQIVAWVRRHQASPKWFILCWFTLATEEECRVRKLRMWIVTTFSSPDENRQRKSEVFLQEQPSSGGPSTASWWATWAMAHFNSWISCSALLMRSCPRQSPEKWIVTFQGFKLAKIS